MHQQHAVLLLVDGDIARAEKLGKRLQHLGYEIRTAANGAAGLLLAHERKPEAIVASVDLPILDGYLMAEALRSDPGTSTVPVILITEGSSHEELARAWRVGADLCIPRNHGEADLLATLYRALARPEPEAPTTRDLSYAL